MPYESANVTAQHIAHSVTLGDMTLTADGFTLLEERPYEQQRMWNGDWYTIALGRKPCRLQLQCRAPAALRDTLLPVLRAALENKTAYAFSLGGTAFTDMKLTSYKLHTAEGAAFCHAELTFIGTADDPTAAASGTGG